MWLGRFVGPACDHPPFGVDMFQDFDELRRERQVTDTAMLQWAGKVTSAWLQSTMEYTSKGDGKTRRLPATIAAVHLFNHGIHHRGQLTTLMKQAGLDPGDTDLPWLPGVVELMN